MHDQITRLLSEALATALKEALVPIVREAVNEALKDTQQAQPNDITARLGALEEQVESLGSDLADKVDSGDIDDKVSEAVQDCLDSGSWDITFRG